MPASSLKMARAAAFVVKAAASRPLRGKPETVLSIGGVGRSPGGVR
jgi:hypothetical protein